MNKDEILDDVLEGYAVETPDGNDLEILKKWMSKYPDAADDLMEFASMRAEIKHAPEPKISDEDTSRYKAKGLEMLGQFINASKKKSDTISSLNALAEAQGMDKKAFAAVLGVSISLLTYLEKRRLQAASIPRQLVVKIAESVKTTEESVAAYLSGGPSLSTQTSFKAETRPETAEEKDFADAVNEDPGLTAEQKQALLSLK